MHDPILKQPRINTPQASPFAPNQKEWYKHEHAHPVHINPLKHDTSASFDDDEDQFFKKLKLRNDTPTAFFGIPALTAPSNITLNENSLALVSKTSGNDSKPINLERALDRRSSYSDYDMEKEVHGAMGDHRTALNEGANFTFGEIRHKQHFQKFLHTERDQMLKELIERESTSNALSWVQTLSTVALFGVALLAAGCAIVTGNIPGAIGILGALAGGTQSVSVGVNGFYSIATKEIVGNVKDNKLKSELEHNDVTALLSTNQTTLSKIHEHNRNESTIEKNRSQIKIF